MQTINVNLGRRSYPIWVKQGLIKELTPLLNKLNQRQQWVIITQPSLADLAGNELANDLETAGFKVSLLTIPKGEQAKSLSQIESLYHQLIELNCDRSSALIALGGGVVGDVTGFVAATFMRGIDYIQIPTTLLAMVDSAIGGKTGVNLPTGKNLIGSIYQPRTVAIDPGMLNSLPKRELVSGLAEVLKYGAIADTSFFEELRQNMNVLLSLADNQLLESSISKSCTIKATIVARDEHEGDLRRILNFGHTIGHALETTSGYSLRHGEAIAYGMLCAGKISRARNLITESEFLLLKDTIKQLPLPSLLELNEEKILATIKRDKKVRAGTLHFVLLQGLGNAVVADDISEADILKALEIL